MTGLWFYRRLIAAYLVMLATVAALWWFVSAGAALVAWGIFLVVILVKNLFLLSFPRKRSTHY